MHGSATEVKTGAVPSPLTARRSQNALARSSALHERVRRFARLAETPPLVPPPDADDFATLARDIAAFQADECPGFARLLEARAGSLDDPDRIPAVPVDAFKAARVAAHPRELDALVFRTSGTTADVQGQHPVRDLETYRLLALTLGRHSLFSHRRRAVVVALAPAPTKEIRSSLGYMMDLFMEEFDGRALSSDPDGAPFSTRAPERWLLTSGDVDLAGLRRACRIARARNEPLFLLSTSFALAVLLDALDDERIELPRGSTLMLTGGFKGHRTTLSEVDLRARASEALGLDEGMLLGEYGMTELTSQLYEAWSPRRPGKRLALTPSWWPESGRPGHYHAPPWLYVTAVDPGSHLPVAPGEVGVARFVDLGNVDSAVCIVTEDLIRKTEHGVELLGRRPGSPVRGCSLPYEGLLLSGRGTRGSGAHDE